LPVLPTRLLFPASGRHRSLHSFPTRRSSDLPGEASAVVTDVMGPVTEIDAPADSFTPPTGKHILIMPCSSAGQGCVDEAEEEKRDRKSTRLNSSHVKISYAVFCLKKKTH